MALSVTSHMRAFSQLVTTRPPSSTRSLAPGERPLSPRRHSKRCCVGTSHSISDSTSPRPQQRF
jgi:hypothetical protein